MYTSTGNSEARNNTSTACLDTVVAPSAVAGGLVNVGLQLWGELGQVQEDVAGAPKHRRGIGQLALGVDQLCRVQQVATAITLVSSCILQGCVPWL